MQGTQVRKVRSPRVEPGVRCFQRGTRQSQSAGTAGDENFANPLHP